VQLYYQIGLAGRRDLEYAPDVRSGFEMVLIRMLAFRPAQLVGRRQVVQEAGMESETLATDTGRFPPTAEKKTQSDTDRTVQDNWRDIIDEMALVGLVRELAGHCVLKEHTKDMVHLVLSPAKEHLLNTAQKERLLAALQTRFGEAIKVRITVADPDAETPAERKAREARERQLVAEQAVAEDPAVKVLQDMFDATIDRNSVRPNTD